MPSDPSASPADDAITADEVARLIEEIRRLRLTVTTDLSAAAGAMDSGEPGVAREILSADRREIAGFAQRLRDETTEQPAAVPAVPGQRRRTRRRALLALPAIPLVGTLAMTTAIALHGSDDHHNPTSHQTAAPSTVPPGSANIADDLRAPNSTLRHLANVLTHHPHAAQVMAVANRLHSQLSALIASSPDDPLHRAQVRQLLALEQRLLKQYPVPGVSAALAAARHLARELYVPAAPTSSPHSTATKTPTPTSTKTPNSAPPFGSGSPQPTHVPSHMNSSAPAPTPSSKHSRPPHSSPPNPLSDHDMFP